MHYLDLYLIQRKLKIDFDTNEFDLNFSADVIIPLDTPSNSMATDRNYLLGDSKTNR